MVPREPGEFGGEYYRLMPEGTLKHCDGLTDRRSTRTSKAWT